MNTLKVGVGREEITPKVGTRLYGYNPTQFSKSVNDNLTVTAIAFEHDKERVVLISATVCLIDSSLSDEIRKKISENLKVKYTNIILSATHTHSGPCTASSTGWGDVDDSYCKEIFIPKTINAAKKALENVKPAVMGIGEIKSKVGINRRQFLKDNRIEFGQNPWGCYDPNMTVISFKETSGAPIANIVHYGAHCTAAGCNFEITRDWAGVMTDRLEKESGAITAFFNGSEGDVGPRLTNGLTVGNIQYAMDLGSVAANDAVKAYKSIKEYNNPGLNVALDDLKLPYDDMLSLEEAKAKLKENENLPRENICGRTYEYYKSIVDAYELNFSPKKYFEFKQTIIKIGSVVFVPFPYEIFSEISLRLRTYSEFPYLLCLGCTNGSNGYLPSQDQICRGGYEVDYFLTSGVQNLVKNTDDYIVSENLRIMEELKCTE